MNIIDKLKSIIAENPHYIGLVVVLVGIGGLISAIANANWLFGDVSGVTYSLKKIDGWVNWFGRKVARIIYGGISVFIILIGIFVFLLGALSKYK